MTSEKVGIVFLVRNRSVQIAVVLWSIVNVPAMALTYGGIPLNIPALNQLNPIFAVVLSSIAIVVLLIGMGIVLFLTRARPFPKLDLRIPDRATAKKEAWSLWIYVALGPTRVQSPFEVWTWATYNGVLLALFHTSHFAAAATRIAH